MDNNLKKGNIISARVTGIEKYGIFVKVADDYNGMIHISEISYKFVKDVNKYAKVGDIIKVEVLDVREDEKKLVLGMKDVKKKSTKLEEGGSGFQILKDKLDTWIKNY